MRFPCDGEAKNKADNSNTARETATCWINQACIDRLGECSLQCAPSSTAAVAQLVESRIVIPVVVGSSPISHPSSRINYKFTNSRRRLSYSLSYLDNICSTSSHTQPRRLFLRWTPQFSSLGIALQDHLIFTIPASHISTENRSPASLHVNPVVA